MYYSNVVTSRKKDIKKRLQIKAIKQFFDSSRTQKIAICCIYVRDVEAVEYFLLPLPAPFFKVLPLPHP